MTAGSATVRLMIDYLESVVALVGDPTIDERAGRPEASGFRFGNPQEMPLPEIQQARRAWWRASSYISIVG